MLVYCKICDFLLQVVRTVSHFAMQVFLGTRQPPIEKALTDKNGRLRTDQDAIKHSRYVVYMRHWLKYFKLKQFLLIDTNNMITNPLNATTETEKFLGLEHKITEDNFVYGENKGFYCFKLHPNTTRICMDKKKGRHHPHLTPAFERKLRNYFAPFNKRFYKLVGRDFGWNK